ncbi:MFS transporter [Brevibacillus humidisoli]|uniref:MFS transporter n=1 Tax=Brevibacillus humidisoli TaxID=2895522 RepID=UPI001E2AD2CC|nr:MFS transporter [Brevibacillus humidisoli]
MAVVGTIGPLGGIAGPGLGGLLTEAWGWQSVFFVNVPFCLVALLLMWRLLPNDTTKRHQPYDFVGSIALSAGALLLLLGLTSSYDLSLLFLIAGVCLLLSFPLIEKRVRHPLVPPAMFGKGDFTLPLAGVIASSIAGSGLGFIAAFFLQIDMGLSPAQAGFAVLAVPVSMMAASQIGGIITDRMGSRLAAMIGAAMGLLGLALLLPLQPDWSIADVMLRFVLIGFGQGLFASPANVAIMAATLHDYLGVSSAITNLLRQLGFALGPAIAAFMWRPDAIDSLESMRSVFSVLLVVQMITFTTTLRYRNPV